MSEWEEARELFAGLRKYGLDGYGLAFLDFLEEHGIDAVVVGEKIVELRTQDGVVKNRVVEVAFGRRPVWRDVPSITVLGPSGVETLPVEESHYQCTSPWCCGAESVLCVYYYFPTEANNA